MRINIMVRARAGPVPTKGPGLSDLYGVVRICPVVGTTQARSWPGALYLYALLLIKNYDSSLKPSKRLKTRIF